MITYRRKPTPEQFMRWTLTARPGCWAVLWRFGRLELMCGQPWRHWHKCSAKWCPKIAREGKGESK